jgi:hypothetical protein
LKRSPRAAAGLRVAVEAELRLVRRSLSRGFHDALRALRRRGLVGARVACLSTRDQVTYSFCRMFESFHFVTEPWQRLLAQFTTPEVLAVEVQGKGCA